MAQSFFTALPAQWYSSFKKLCAEEKKNKYVKFRTFLKLIFLRNVTYSFFGAIDYKYSSVPLFLVQTHDIFTGMFSSFHFQNKESKNFLLHIWQDFVFIDTL